jgi:hypothetical protein
LARRIVSALMLVTVLATAAPAEVSLDLSLGREQAYLGETVPVTVTLRISGETVRNIGYPRLVAPDGSMVIFAAPQQLDQLVNSAHYRFVGQVYGVKPGMVTVGPATLECETLATAAGSDAFFGAVEPRLQSLSSPVASLRVQSLPSVGRPKTFSGAIGRYIMMVTAQPPVVAPGEPLTITSTIRGTGTLDQASCPKPAPSVGRVYPPRASRQSGLLTCEQVVVPLVAGVVPPLAWAYFDPRKGQYRQLQETVPARVVAPPPLSSPPKVQGGADTPSPRPTSADGAGWLPYGGGLLSLVLVSGLFWLWGHRRSSSLAPFAAPTRTGCPEQLAELEQALARRDVDGFYMILFRIIQERICRFSAVPARAVSSLAPLDCPPDLMAFIPLLAICDEVRYGRKSPSFEQMLENFHQIKQLSS